jgi:hypothetical protein
MTDREMEAEMACGSEYFIEHAKMTINISLSGC